MTLRDEMSRSNRQPAHKKWQDGKFYDELIFESAAYLEQLPRSIEAMFYLTTNCKVDIFDGPKCKDYVQKVRCAMKLHAMSIVLDYMDLANVPSIPLAGTQEISSAFQSDTE